MPSAWRERCPSQRKIRPRIQPNDLPPVRSFFSADIWNRPKLPSGRLCGRSLSAEALYGIGSVYLNQNKNADAHEMFERCVKLKPNYPETLPDAWNNLGVLATREKNISESIRLSSRR